MPSKGLTPFICCYRAYRWPPDFSVSPHCVPFSSSLLFGNRSQRLATPHTQDTRMKRNGQIRSSTKLERRSRRVQALCRSHSSRHQEDLAACAYPSRRRASTRVVIIKLGAHMQKGGSQLSPLFLFLHTLIDSPHAYGILQSKLQKTRWTVDSCDLKKVDMTAAPKDAPTEIHCSERHTGSSGMTLPEGTCPRRTSLARCFLFDMAEKVKRRRPQVRLSRETVGAARVTSGHCSTL